MELNELLAVMSSTIYAGRLAAVDDAGSITDEEKMEKSIVDAKILVAKIKKVAYKRD